MTEGYEIAYEPIKGNVEVHELSDKEKAVGLINTMIQYRKDILKFYIDDFDDNKWEIKKVEKNEDELHLGQRFYHVFLAFYDGEYIGKVTAQYFDEFPRDYLLDLEKDELDEFIKEEHEKTERFNKRLEEIINKVL